MLNVELPNIVSKALNQFMKESFFSHCIAQKRVGTDLSQKLLTIAHVNSTVSSTISGLLMTT